MLRIAHLPSLQVEGTSFRTRLKEHDRRPGCGTMYIVSVPPGS